MAEEDELLAFQHECGVCADYSHARGWSHPRIEESLRTHDNDKPKGNNDVGPSVVNMVEHNNSFRYNDNRGKRKHHDTKSDPNKKLKVTYWKCGKPRHLKRDCKAGNVSNKANGSGIKGLVDGSSNSLKGQNMFNKSLQEQLFMCVKIDAGSRPMKYDCFFFKFEPNSRNFTKDVVEDISTTKEPQVHNDLPTHPTLQLNMKFQPSGAIVHVCKDRCWFKTYESLNDRSILHMGNKSTTLVHGRGCVDLSDLCDLHATPSLGNKKYFMAFIDDASRFCYVYLLHSKDEALDKFKVFKPEVELQQGFLIKRFRTDRGGEYMDTMYFQLVGIIHEKTDPYTPQQNGCRAVVRLPGPKLKTLGERGIECIFVGYAKHSKAFRFFVIEPNESDAINSIIELRDAIFNENRLSSVCRPSLMIPNGTEDNGGSVVTEEVVQQLEPELRKSKSHRTPKNIGPKFQLYLIEGTRDEGFKQKSEIDYFDTYAPVARISTIRLLIAMALIHNLIIHQMDVKTVFLNGKLEEEAPKQWHQKFDEVVLSNGYLLNQAKKYVYRKFDESGKGVIISLYVDDMLIFGTNQVQVDLTKEFLSSGFSMKDMKEAHVILVLLMDTYEKLMPNNGQAVSQLEYSRVIGCLMYAMTYTRPDIAFVMGKLSRYTSSPGSQHWQAIQRESRDDKDDVHDNSSLDVRIVDRHEVDPESPGYWLLGKHEKAVDGLKDKKEKGKRISESEAAQKLPPGRNPNEAAMDSSVALTAFGDADHAGCQDTRRSTSGSVQFLGERLISWSSKRQKSVAISSTEAEYIALSGCCAIRSHGKTNGVFLCAGSLTNSLDTRNHLKIRTTFSSGQPGRPHLCINTLPLGRSTNF
nr:zinc finger, CCHC-type [Tanacetum cinerariifolium]